jgi:hypothetical protein
MIGRQHRRMRALTDPVVQTNPPVLPGAMVGVPYAFQLTAAGVLPNEIATWETKYGTSLPPSLTLSSDGMISGIPTAIGTYNIAIGVSHETA